MTNKVKEALTTAQGPESIRFISVPLLATGLPLREVVHQPVALLNLLLCHVMVGSENDGIVIGYLMVLLLPPSSPSSSL